MSPEQAQAEPLDARSDIYAVGAVGYYLMTGKPPFERDSALGVLIAHARDPVRAPTELRADIPADLEAVLVQCLAKKPADRFANAAALEQALGACACAGHWTAQQAELWWKAHPIRPATAVDANAPTVERPVSVLAG
jgi:serine/threonine-protein kinase